MRQAVVDVLAIVWVVGYISASLLVFFVEDFNAHQMYWVYTTFYAFLTLVYTLMIAYIIRMINKLTTKSTDSVYRRTFEKEKNSVKYQFWFFLLAYITRVAFFGAVLIVNADDENESFSATFAEAILYIPWNVIPVATILYEHFRTFKMV